jgi:hypothetical protein
MLAEDAGWVIIAGGMKPEIARKLDTELRSGIITEAQVVYLMVGIRKIMEEESSGAAFPYLRFHADWVLHSQMDRNAIAKEILELFDNALPHLKAGVELHKLPSRFKRDFERIIKMERFEEELEAFLQKLDLATLYETRTDGWTFFLHLYCKVIQHCPLVVTGTALNEVAKINVWLEEAIKTIKHEYGEEMPYKVNWDVTDSKGGQGTVFVMNSFSIEPPLLPPPSAPQTPIPPPR